MVFSTIGNPLSVLNYIYYAHRGGIQMKTRIDFKKEVEEIQNIVQDVTEKTEEVSEDVQELIESTDELTKEISSLWESVKGLLIKIVYGIRNGIVSIIKFFKRGNK